MADTRIAQPHWVEHTFHVTDDRDLVYQAQIGNLDVIHRGALYAKARQGKDVWEPVHDRNLGWVAQHQSTLHIAYGEEADGRWRPIRCSSQEEAASLAGQLNDAERRHRNIVAFSARVV